MEKPSDRAIALFRDRDANLQMDEAHEIIVWMERRITALEKGINGEAER